jgi:hypothetical protein
MELFAESLSVVGALVLSVSCGLLLEELVFGGLVRLFFAPSRFRHRDPPQTKAAPHRILDGLRMQQQAEGGDAPPPANQGNSADR